MRKEVEGSSPSERVVEAAPRPDDEGPRESNAGVDKSGRTTDDSGRGRTAPASTKLYAIGRTDLSPGLRAAQLGHACITWTVTYGTPPENLVLLEVPDEAALDALMWNLAGLAPLFPLVAFYEPDLGGEHTALATAHPDAHRALSSLPLAFKGAPE